MALVQQTQELQREVDTVQQLRRALHEAYIAEAHRDRQSSTEAHQPPSAMEVHRTVDAPTLNVLKAPNYPFTLCEEAPPSYVPPPVPYDVEGEIESLKQRVLQVQEQFQVYHKKLSPRGTPLSHAQVLDFFGTSTTYAEMAWEVSSLQWFYRWVLSHSISHLWNCKEQLEYVLTEKGQELPQSAEEMDGCLQEFPFAAAVSILDTDRQSIVAQERRRLRSVSRTLRERLPSTAVTAATSCYLTPEEKYMYQEFFNQSEHMLLLLNHTLMLNRANSGLVMDGQRGSQGTAAGYLSYSQDSGHSPSATPESGAVAVPVESMIGELDTAGLAEETLHAISAEQDVIHTLMNTIRERQQRDECFDVSEGEQQRSRKAQIAVYGCVLSDMSLMGQQMNLAAEFVDRYEGWLKLRGCTSHEQLMSELAVRSGGTAWPMLRVQTGADGAHDHFIPPTEEMLSRQPRSADKPEKGDLCSHFDAPHGPGGKKVQATAPAPTAKPAPPPTHAASPTPTKEAVTASLPNASDDRQPNIRVSSEVANAYLQMLHRITAVCKGNASVARAWLTASVRYTVIKIVRREWDIAAVSKEIAQAEEELLSQLRWQEETHKSQKDWSNHGNNYARLTTTASALCVIASELARLCATKCEMRSLTVEAPVAIHVPEDADDYAQAVADIMNPVEETRWGAVLDAVWFQVDPSAQSSEGLLLPLASAAAATTGEDDRTVDSPVAAAAAAVNGPGNHHHNTAGPVRFLSLESIDAPPTPQNSGVASITLRYRLPRMSPAVPTSRRAAPSLAVAAAAQPSGGQGVARYQLARSILNAFFEVEAKGLLPCFACRVAEAPTVPLAQVSFLTFHDTNTGVVVSAAHLPQICLLPPAAIELKRLYAEVGTAPSPERPADAFFETYAAPINFSSLGLMLGTLLEDVAIRVPVLNDLYMTAAMVREQALSEIQAGAVSKCFANASTHPFAVTCAPARTRVISIQRESVANPNNTASTRRFVAPLLRRVQDTIATIQKGSSTASPVASSSHPDGSVVTPRYAPQPASLTGRQTQMAGGINTTSPSPSAIRPTRR